jgi:Xaa-Pro aminopeptidase
MKKTIPKLSKTLLQEYSQVFPVGSVSTEAPKLLQQRRAKHLKHLKELDSFCVFAGVPREPGAENLWIMNGLRIFQEPALMYLTGVNQPEIYLLLDPNGKHPETLFLPVKNPKKEFWDGLRFGYTEPEEGENYSKAVQETMLLTGISHVRPVSELKDFLLKAAYPTNKKKPKIGHVFYHQYQNIQEPSKPKVVKTDHNWAFYQKVKKWLPKVSLNPYVEEHFKMRLPLDRYQIQDVKKAIKSTRAGFLETLQNLPHFKGEHDLSIFLEYAMRKGSVFGLSFPSIVAAGRNATVLHYLKNDAPLKRGQLVLMDFGVRHGTMHADISRTFPVNGQFNPMQKLLYNIVYKALKFNQKNAVTGVTIRTLNKKVWAFIEDALEKEFTSRGGVAKREYKGQPHGVSHLMGEQEHDGDPFRLYQDIPLKKGWQISNEPGLYGHFSMTLDGKRYSEYIGIRLEDNLIVGTQKSQNMSASIPVKSEDIERYIGRLS